MNRRRRYKAKRLRRAAKLYKLQRAIMCQDPISQRARTDIIRRRLAHEALTGQYILPARY